MIPSKPSLRAWVTLAGLMVLLSFPAACGKKAPPAPPTAVPPPPVRDLEGEVEAGVVRLRWSHPGGNVEWFRLYRYRAGLDEPACEECPIRFRRIADLPAQPEGMAYAAPLPEGYRYRFKVVPVARGGLSGADSNPVELIH